jgi:TetR/AcrR family transcriptional regulator, transcriptional repressor for nem operon
MVTRGRSGGGETASRVLDVAERLVQQRGFNAFSYADVASELQITKAALHYHFAGKAELGAALLARYARRFAEALSVIDAENSDGPRKLAAYADLYLDVLRNRRMCLCGMLAAEFQTLPGPMRDIVIQFFNDNETWLARLLDHGRGEGTLRFSGSSNETARLIVATLEGAMLVTLPYGDVARFQTAASSLVGSLVVPASRGARATSV